ncbi:MAG TPA: Uma2 family endonuclease [Gemmatimonadaceae bacterium]|nr:Uma2 family endonuclease [Gemmatimonadaceae bacterium]
MSVPIGTKQWTLAEVHSLPDDGNKYELVRGELFVTPCPSVRHESIAARLTRILDPYVEANGLGLVHRPRAVLRVRDSEVEPDLMVRQEPPDPDWARAPTPILVVEILSGSTRRRDWNQKRAFYLDAGVAEYWIVDPDARSITVIRRDAGDAVSIDRLTWSPPGADAPLIVDLARVFG